MPACTKCGKTKSDDEFRVDKRKMTRRTICRDCDRAYNRRYFALPAVRARFNLVYQVRYRRNPKYNLSRRVHSAMWRALHGAHETWWEQLVGYSLADLRDHLEGQFVGGMCWGNHGEWHIDHAQPLCAFDQLADQASADFRECWALKNLRPLWAIDNRRKAYKAA